MSNDPKAKDKSMNPNEIIVDLVNRLCEENKVGTLSVYLRKLPLDVQVHIADLVDYYVKIRDVHNKAPEHKEIKNAYRKLHETIGASIMRPGEALPNEAPIPAFNCPPITGIN